MGQSLLHRIREAMLDAAPFAPLVSHHDRDVAIMLLRQAISEGDTEEKLVYLAAAVELRAFISEDIWRHCRDAANDSGDGALCRLFRSARGRSYILPTVRTGKRTSMTEPCLFSGKRVQARERDNSAR
ncbi:hypothetical protein DAMDJJ_08680 [Cupriavidus necator]|uniref:hypothetical protein n=1 Tax=Cupriavidus necator TaxID=106590 RepID=UPI003F732B78